MTVGAQPSIVSFPVDTPAVTAPGTQSDTELFGGIIAALAAAGTKPTPAGTQALPEGVPPTPCKLATLEEEGVETVAPADQLLALSAALPAQGRIVVRKPGQPDIETTAETEEEEAADAGVETAEPQVAGPVPIAPLLPGQAAPLSLTLKAKAEVPVDTASPKITIQPAALEVKLQAEAPQPVPELLKLPRPQRPEPVREAIRAVLAQAVPVLAGVKPAKHGEPAPLAPEIKIASSLFTPMPFLAPEIMPQVDAPTPVEAPVELDTAELVIERQLDLASGDEWLDDLARDIARTAGNEGSLKFRLNPEHLGSLKVELMPDRGGTAVRLTAETDAARAIIADAQPRLIAEARAQGLRISEAHVDLGQPGGDPRRDAGDHAEPHLRTARSVQDEEPSDGKPTGGTSERYA
jgi:flagellar hook-length control protein FliK